MDWLRKFWAGWKRFGEIMGNLVARLFLTLFYFTIFLPFGLGSRLAADFLGIKQKNPRWFKRPADTHYLKDARRLT
jgi:hypothetical protein